MFIIDIYKGIINNLIYSILFICKKLYLVNPYDNFPPF